MKNLIVSVLFVLVSIFGFSQNKYDFDIPLRAKNDIGVFEWYIDALDSTSDSLLIKMFEMTGTDTDSIHWEYSTGLVDSLTLYGQDLYYRKSYVANNKDKKIEGYYFPGKSELGKKLYSLFYTYKDGVVYMVLVEYF